MDNYKEKWDSMLERAAQYPDTLNNTKTRLKARIRRKKRREFCSVLSMAATIFLFVFLVNVSPAFAGAVYDIPVIGRLAELVKFDKSLSGAIHNDYAQTVGLYAEDDGIALCLPYVIADEKNLVLLYQLPDPLIPDSDDSSYELYMNDIKDGDTGLSLDGYSYESVMAGYEELQKTHGLILQKLSFEDITPPRHLILTVKLDKHDDPAFMERSFSFELYLNSFAPAKVYEFEQELSAFGQRFTLMRMLLYPTVTQIDIRLDDNNSSLIKGFDLSILENGKEVLKKNSNGVTASYDDSMIHLYLESNYFEPGQKRELAIQGIQMIPKEEEYLTIDLNKGTMTPGVDELRLKSVNHNGTSAQLTFENDAAGYLPISMTYQDSNGITHNLGSIMSTSLNSSGELSFYVSVPSDGIIILQRTLTAPTPLAETLTIDIPALN